MEFGQLNARQIATILAALRLFQREAERFNMTEAFREHFENGAIKPLSTEEIDFLCESIGVDTKDTAYITREFVRQDCGIHGAELSDEDCDVIIAEVRLLTEQGKFNHSGVYWIANRLAAEGQIHPSLPKNV